MLDKEFKQFTESGVEKEIDYTPAYQITRLATDNYQFYDFTERKAALCNARGLLKKVAEVRGGHVLNRELSAHILNMEPFGTVTVASDALQLNKTASTTDSEPWKVVAVNGIEYFVSANACDQTEEEDTVKKTAAFVPQNHIYTVHIKAHNVREIAKIAACAEQTMGALPATTQIPTQEEISFDVETQEPQENIQTSIQKALENEGIYLHDSNVGVYNDTCPCGCGRGGKHDHDHANHHKHPMVGDIQDLNVPEGYFVLVPVASTKRSFSKSASTLKSYASAHYETFNIYNDKLELVASESLDPKSPSFGEELTAFLDEQIKLNATADNKVTIISPDNTERPEGEPPQIGDTVIDKTNGSATKVTSVNADEDTTLAAMGAEETKETEDKVKDPNEKPAEETKASGDDDVKRWKGMREDPTSGKYIVYITETTEHIYDNLDDAVNFMTRN